MPFDRHVVGRIGEDEVDALVAEQGAVVLGLARVAAQQPVASELPDVAAPTDRALCRYHSRVLRPVRGTRISVRCPVEHEIDLRPG